MGPTLALDEFRISPWTILPGSLLELMDEIHEGDRSLQLALQILGSGALRPSTEEGTIGSPSGQKLAFHPLVITSNPVRYGQIGFLGTRSTPRTE
jgi:hypothetical protein